MWRIRMAWTLGLSLAAFGVVPGHATVREWLMQRAGLDPLVLASTPSIRVTGMGELNLGVPDERNELNAWDFGGNVAGILDDGERWAVESWLGNHVQNLQDPDYSAERRFGHSGVRVIRRWENRALGVDVNHTTFENTESGGDWTKIGGPLVSAVINQRFGPVSVGLILGHEAEKESRISPDFFAISHEQGRWLGQLGADTELYGFRWGAAWAFERGDVVGTGIDPERFHEDTFTWVRPVDRYTLYALLARSERLEGGLRLRAMDRKGSESVRVSWSGESPMNPSQTKYFADAVSFAEEESDWDLVARWRLHADEGTVLGAEAGYRSWDHRVDEGIEFKGSIRAGYAERKAFTFGAGASRRIVADRLLFALEGRGALEDWTTEETLQRATDGQARRFAIGAGLEFFATDRLVLRSGLSLLSDDQNADEPLSLRTGRVISGGVSWVPLGGLMQIEGAVRYQRLVPKDVRSPLEDTTETQYAIGLRWLL